MKKIALVCLETINNGGDDILAETMRYLLEGEGASVRKIQIEPDYEEKWSHLNLFEKLEYRITRRLNRLLKGKSFFIQRRFYSRFLRDYFRDEFTGFDGIVVALGMFKFRTQKFSFLFDAITDAAERLGVPVMLNSMSIARPDANDKRYHQLVKALNRPAVKLITTRDGEWGLERLREHYIKRKDLAADWAGDPGLWAAEAYGAVKKDGGVTGINLIRPKIIGAYLNDVTPEEMHAFYAGLIAELERKKVNWVLFSNGVEDDYEFGRGLIADLGLDENRLLPRPKNAGELVETIAGFSRILGVRLHACIVAAALGVPFIGLSWDDKLRYFAKTMGLEENFIEVEGAKPEEAARLLADGPIKAPDADTVRQAAEKTRRSVIRFLDMV